MKNADKGLSRPQILYDLRIARQKSGKAIERLPTLSRRLPIPA
ncbi:MAG: hypothetical protein WA324_19845 [Bryobacteraceae bacterium]